MINAMDGKQDMKFLPVGIQTFSSSAQGGYVCVDKTERIHRLLRKPKGFYFLSRPRRF
ncbi:MAG: AAA family ATPase, partial [Myxococcota bacterium]